MPRSKWSDETKDLHKVGWAKVVARDSANKNNDPFGREKDDLF